VLIILSGWDELKASLSAFPWIWFPVIIALSFANYLFRFLKWDYYLNLLQIKLKKSDSLIVFLSGLIMTISPGKIGELLKALFLKQINNTPMSKSAPIVIAERLTDFVALVIISLAGLAIFTVGNYMVVIGMVVAVLVGFIGVVSHRGLSLWLIGLVERMPLIGRFGQKFHTAYESIHRLVKLAPLSVATFWSLMAWLCECIGFWIVLRTFSAEAKALTASFIYALGTIVGVVSPGGLGVMEGSMVGLLQTGTVMEGRVLSMAEASAATMIIRIATLWFAVFVGAVVLLAFQKRFAPVSQMLDETPQD
jgi:uncharacterized protein (TIRG00374 family)